MNNMINETQHQQIQLLLPWYINHSLEQFEKSQVESHISHCLLCRSELTNLRKISEVVSQESNMELAAEISFAKLAAKLPQQSLPPINLQKSPTASSHTYYKCFTTFNRCYYAAAASILLLLVPLILQMTSHPDQNTYYTLADAKLEALATDQLRIVFAKTVSSGDIVNILSQLHGQQVGEVNSLGALTVRLDSKNVNPSLEQAITMLRSRQDVLLVEPVLKP